MFDCRTQPAASSTPQSLERGAAFGQCSSAAHGFTLVELLMVVLIIGILAGLISTAFSTTKSKSRRVSCMNNLRQLQVAWRLYIDDNDDALPLNRTAPGDVNDRIFGFRNSSNSW